MTRILYVIFYSNNTYGGNGLIILHLFHVGYINFLSAICNIIKPQNQKTSDVVG